MTNLIDLYPHNKVVFNKVLENLKTHNKVGVVQATGTGKGKLAACLIEFLIYHKSNAKILIVAPLRSILENYKSNFNLEFNNIKYITYQKLNNLSDTDLEKIGKSCDLIILDEYHRCGATEWYKSIIKLFKSVDENKCKVVGLTATPIRYLDNSRDMSEELFNNNVIEGLNLEEAILDGILPGFVYNACYYGVETTLKEVRDKLENNEYRISDDTIRNDLLVKVKELNMLYHNRYKIENIIKENTKDLGKNQKWVIFCKDKENLYEIRKYCVNWFNGNPNLYIINSDKQGVDNDRTLTEFRKIKEGINVLLCVNMLNEGVHIKDLNGVIMLRKTDSPILFLQQLGRSLETGKQFQPIIFDLIGNYRGLRIEEDGVEKTPIDIVRGIEKRTKDKKNYVIVHNFTEEMHNVLNEISFYSYGVWSDNEIDILMTYYPIGGADLCLEKGLNKTRQAIVVKAYKLKLTEDSKYTDNEIEILKKYYLIGGSKLCQEKGVNRTVGSIQKMAQKLGLSENRKYTEKENNIIEKYYLIGGSKMCQEKGLNRTHQSIRSQANRLNLKMENHEYSENEKNILIKYIFGVYFLFANFIH